MSEKHIDPIFSNDIELQSLIASNLVLHGKLIKAENQRDQYKKYWDGALNREDEYKKQLGYECTLRDHFRNVLLRFANKNNWDGTTCFIDRQEAEDVLNFKP